MHEFNWKKEVLQGRVAGASSISGPSGARLARHEPGHPGVGPAVQVCKVNVDTNPQLASHYSVTSIAVLKICKDGKPAARHLGVTHQATLRAELLDPGHTAVRQHLQGGDPYVWCTLQPIDEDGRGALRKKATEVSHAADGFLQGGAHSRILSDCSPWLRRTPRIPLASRPRAR